MASRPQTLYAIADSPVGLAAWLIDFPFSLDMMARSIDGLPESLTRDDVLDNCTLYWLTNTGVSSSRLYRENTFNYFSPKGVNIPVAVSVFPDEIYLAPRSWAETAYPQARPLQQSRQGRSLCRLGTAEDLYGRTARGIQITARIDWAPRLRCHADREVQRRKST
jgi:hypothetical protein